MKELTTREKSRGSAVSVAIDQAEVLKVVGLNPHDPTAQAILLICDRYGLDPLLKHVVPIKGQIYVTRDGLLHVAHLSRQFDGMEVISQGETQTHHTAKVAVYRKDMSHPFIYIGRYPKAGQNRAYGPEMAVKCAEVMGLRRAFNVALAAREELWDRESELEPPPAALTHHAANLPNHTGHSRTGAYAKPETIAEYKQWLKAFVEGINGKWLDAHTSEDGQLPAQLKDLLSTFQVSRHLLKWGREQGLIEVPAEPRSRQVDPLVAVIFDRNPSELETEAKSYARARWKEAKAALDPPELETESQIAPDDTDECDPDGDYPPEPGMDG